MTSGFIFVLIAKYVTHSLSVSEKKKRKERKENLDIGNYKMKYQNNVMMLVM